MAFVLEVSLNLLGRQHKLVSCSTSRSPSNFVTFSKNQRCLFSILATLNTHVQSVVEKHLARVNDVPIPIMVNNCMEKMGQPTIETGISAGLHIVPASFGIQRDAGKTVQVGGKDIELTKYKHYTRLINFKEAA